MEQQKRNKRQVGSLVKNGIVLPPHLTDKQKRQVQRASSVMERMEVQWKFLGADAEWEGMKQTAQCCRRGIPRMEKVSWEHGKPELYRTAQDFVEVDFYDSGRINPRGTVKCNGLECSWCGRHKRKELSDYLEMALQWNTRNGGRNVFGTMTQQVQTDANCVLAASKALGEVLKRVDKWNTKNKTEIGMFTTQETLFSPKQKFHPYRDTTGGKFGIGFHSHVHFILLIPKRDEPKVSRLLELMRTWWVNSIEKHGGIVFRHNSKNLINHDVAYKVEKDVPPDKAISRYITKHLKSKELVYAETKTGDHNIGLEELKTRIHLGCELQNAYIAVMRDYYRALKNRSRFKSTKKIIANLVYQWKQHLDFLRTAAAYDFVVGQPFSQMRGRPRHEITIISQIKAYELETKEESGETMGRIFGIRSLPSHKKSLREAWEHRDKEIKTALEEGAVLWNGDRNTWIKNEEAELREFLGEKVSKNDVDELILRVRKKEVELWENGEWSYLQDNGRSNQEVLVATYRFATKFWNLITEEGEVARVLYRMRNKFLLGTDGLFYEFIHHLNQIFMREDYQIEKELPKLKLPVKPAHKDLSTVPDVLKGVLRRKGGDAKEWVEENKKKWEEYNKKMKEVKKRGESRKTRIKERNRVVRAYLNEAMNENDEWLGKQIREMSQILHSRKQ